MISLRVRSEALDGRSDVYSLGLVLYEMLTGRLPFDANNGHALLVQRLQVEPMPLDRARLGLTFSPDVSRLVMKALEKDRGSRYRSAEEMERAIAAALVSLRAEREQAEAARLTAQRRLEEVEKAGLAAEGAKRLRQERGAAEAAPERAERERPQRRMAETTRTAELQAEQERLDREEADREKGKQSGDKAQRRPVGGVTRIKSGRPRSRPLVYGLVLAVTLTAVFSMAHYFAEKSARIEQNVSSRRRPSSSCMQQASRRKTALGCPLVDRRGPDPKCAPPGSRVVSQKVNFCGQGNTEASPRLPLGEEWANILLLTCCYQEGSKPKVESELMPNWKRKWLAFRRDGNWLD